MKIRDDNGMPRGVPINPRPVQGSRPDQTPQIPTGKNPVGDRVELSDRARALRVAKEALAKQPEIQHDRVETLKRMVKADAYKVPGREVAKRMLGDSLFG